MSLTLMQSLQALLGPGFEIRRELHGGGMSRVFVAHERALKRDVVVKVLPPDLISTTSLARFRQEIEVTAQLQHPHILPVVSTGGSDSLIYYVMPYVAGGSLRDRLLGGELPSFADGVRMTEELLAAVSVAHERGVVHRDIKPGNVLISEGHAILADFGIARALEALDETATHEVEGMSTSVASPEAYRAPERPRDEAADLYALAVLSFEMFTGSLPANVSASAVTGALLDSHRAASPIRVRAVASVISRALSRDPGARFLTGREFLAALRATAEQGHRRRIATWPTAAAAASLVLAAAWLATDGGAGRMDSAATGDTPTVTPQGITRDSAHGEDMGDSVAVTPAPGFPSRAAIMSTYDSALAMDHDRATYRRLLRSVPPDAPDYPRAQLRLALIEAWSGSPRERENATRAALHALGASGPAQRLGTRDSALAAGIVALGRMDYPAACAAFEHAGAAEPGHDAWMGLGDCRSRDTVVVETAGGLSFRGSYYQAAKAYLEAARTAPPGGGALALLRLGVVAFTERTRVRRGWVDNARVVLGRPMAMADSFAFDTFEPGRAVQLTPEKSLAHNRALAMGSAILRPALVSHSRAEPGDAMARLMLAELLEAEGSIVRSRGDQLTALGEVEAARRLPADSTFDARLGELHLRLLVRANRFEQAGHLLDTLVEDMEESDVENRAHRFLGAALLGGRVALASRVSAQLSRTPGRQIRLRDGGILSLPPALVEAAAVFSVRATLGVCDDSVRTEPARLVGMLNSYFAPAATPAGAAAAYLERPLLQAFPCLGAEGVRVIGEPTHPLGRALLARDDAERARQLERLNAMRTARLAQEQLAYESPEHAMLDAYVYLMAGDSAGARATLTRMLDGIPLMPPPMLTSEYGTAALMRGMILGADLAAAAGDTATARRLGGAVAALWRNADPSLQPIVARMRALAGPDGGVTP